MNNMRKMTDEELKIYKKTSREADARIQSICLEFAVVCVSKIGEVYPDSSLVEKTIEILKELNERENG